MVPKGIAFYRLLLGIAIGGILGLIGSPFPSQAKELTLQDLLDGSAIVIGDKEFGGFRNFESEATGGADPVQPARVVVLPTLGAAGPGLRFVGNFLGDRSVFHADVGQAQTTSFQYEVRTLSGKNLIIDDTLALGRFVLLDLVGGRPIQITETVRDERDQLLGEKFVFVSTFAQELTDALAFAPQDRLVITKKIGLSGGTLDEFRQDFSQVPASSTLIVFAPSTVGLLVRLATAVIIDDTLALGRFVLLDLVGGRPIQISETVRDEREQLLGEKFVFVSTFAQVLTNELPLAPQDRLVITKKIGLSGGTLDEFRQDFSQVPTPSTFGVFATSTVALLGYARRRRCVSR